MKKNPYLKYKKASIESASKEKLLLLLYEGCIKYMKRAMIAIDEKNIAEKGINIGKAFDIISELNATLNHEVGGEIAANLEKLYIFINDKLTHANIHNDKKAVEDALKITLTLYEGWVEAVDKLKKERNE